MSTVRRWGAFISFLFLITLAGLRATDVDPALRPEITNGRDLQDGVFFGQPNLTDLTRWVHEVYLPNGYVPRMAIVDRTFTRRFAVGAAANGDIYLESAGVYRIPAAAGSAAVQVLPSFSGAVLVQPDGKVIQLNSLRRFKADGSIDATFNVPRGLPPAAIGNLDRIVAGALQADGKIFIGGSLLADNVVRQPHPLLARLNSDGSIDATFAPAPEENIIAVLPLLAGRVLAIEGNVDQQEAHRLTILRADGSLERATNLRSYPGTYISDLALTADGHVLLAGGFLTIGTDTRRNFARLNADGTFDPTFNATGVTNSIDHFTLEPSGKILAHSEARYVRLNSDGSLDASYTAGIALLPKGLELARDSTGRLLLAGAFVTVNGVARPGLARLRADGTLDPTFAPDAATIISAEHVAVQPDGSVVAGGEFRLPGVTDSRRLARFSVSGALDPSFNVTLDTGGRVRALTAIDQGRVVAGGTFATVNGQPHSGVVAFRADGSLDSSFAAGTTFNGDVEQVKLRPSGGVFVAGRFTTVNAQPRYRLAALNADGSLNATFVPALPDPGTPIANGSDVGAIAATADGGVALGTGFSGYNYSASVLRLTSTGAVDPTFQFPLTAQTTVHELGEDSLGRLIVSFHANEKPYYHVHRFARDGSLDLSFNLGSGTSGAVHTLIVESDENILLAGDFNRIDDLPSGSVARIRANRTSPRSALIFNLSTRGHAAPGDDVLIGGFVIGGTQPKTILVRGVGPTLANYGITNPLSNPRLEVHDSVRSLDTNVGWNGWTAFKFFYSGPGHDVLLFGQHTGAAPLETIYDAGLALTLQPGAYTAVLAQSSQSGQWPYPVPATNNGITLFELFDVNALPGDRALKNISTRGKVGPGEDQLIAGFVITGAPRRVLIRAIGPTLTNYAITNPLANPQISVINQQDQVVATNDDWGGGSSLATAFTATGAFSLPPNSKDAALVLTLLPGAYTALVSSRDTTTGIALVEVYDYPE